MPYNNHMYFQEWVKDNKEPNYWTMRQELERERTRMSNALSAIPRYIKETKSPSLEEFSAKTELSMAEILLDNWNDIVQLAVANEKLKGEVDRLLRQIEQMSQAIYTAVENAIRPVRDERINDAPQSRDE